MSSNRSRRGRGKGKNQGSGGNRKRGKQQQQRQRQPHVDPDRPFWSNPSAEADIHRLIDLVRPAQDPTAVVRSLGSPPLGKFADGAPHFYAAVYEKAQRFAIAMAAANGVLVVEGDEEGTAGEAAEAVVGDADALADAIAGTD